MAWIELNDTEQRIADYLAKVRTASNNAIGVVNKKQGPQSDHETTLQGIGAELAFCRLFNIYPDLTNANGNNIDATLRSGETVDVKATKYPNGKMLVVRWKKLGDVSLYVLMVGTFPRYRCAGFFPSDQVLHPDRLVDLGHGPVYAVEQHELHQVAHAAQT